MKQTQEFYGKNVDDAVEKACTSLNIPKNNLKYDIISSGSTGIFGIVGVKKARIRVTLPEKNEKFSSDSQNSDNGMAGVMSIVDEAFGEDKKNQKPASPGKPSKKKKIFHSNAKNAAGKPKWKKSEVKTEKIKDNSSKKELKESPHSGNGLPVSAHPVNDKVVEFESVVLSEEQVKEDLLNEELDAVQMAHDESNEIYDDRDEGYPPKYKDEVPVDVSEEAMELGRKTLQKMVNLMTEDAKVVAESDQDRLLLKVEGGNTGVLIGRRGQTLEAMQFLTDKIINRFSESRVRLKVDIEGYMETRKANLKSLAYKMADKAKKTGKPATINQMTAQDRRIVHLTLKDDARVRTQSMGDGYYRRLVIFPKKGSYNKRRSFKK